MEDAEKVYLPRLLISGSQVRALHGSFIFFVCPQRPRYLSADQAEGFPSKKL